MTTPNSTSGPGRSRTLLSRARSALRTRTRARTRASGSQPANDRPSLNTIGLSTGTDKASTIHGYLGVYESALGHLRDKRFKLIEIGVHEGASLRMWEQFFPRARIVGVDIKKACKRFENDRVTIRIGNQGNPAFLARLAQNHRPLVVLDDGSHRWKHQIDTFRALWPSIRPGGYFIVEDIHTSFGSDYAKTYGSEDGTTAFDYVAGIARGVVAGPRAAAPADDFEAHCRETIESVVMLQHSVIIKKKEVLSPGTG